MSLKDTGKNINVNGVVHSVFYDKDSSASSWCGLSCITIICLYTYYSTKKPPAIGGVTVLKLFPYFNRCK